MRDLNRLDLWSEAFPVHRNAGECGTESVGAVIAGGTADEHDSLGLAELEPVTARDLGGRVDRVTSA